MSQELISVIIPVYNVEQYLAECVNSVCRQTYQNLEIILVNDGSTDASGQICQELADQDARIRLIHQDNQGLSGARNTGIEHSSADYLIFVDSDDWLSSMLPVFMKSSRSTMRTLPLVTTVVSVLRIQPSSTIRQSILKPSIREKR